ncbi:PREDICTED: uncharacterized protein LOC108363294 [Rhagoletis zephyria]|uniref:uncharacterized protein LOC108363294 n=1 Tax=Rhagoletis zephyria TaxID=28612 RepID=UPI000811A509|nr:PREDICTED: uncharacterized protein LOC108363294 [Rhagoletis zephyria]
MHNKADLGKRQEEPKQDNARSRAEAEAALENEHLRLREIAETVRGDYYESYRQMILELRPSHLDEFAKVLMEQQKHVLQKQDELIFEMSEQLMHSLQSSLDRFWKDYDIANRLAELEMLKEQYKEVKGNTWNIQQKTPFQRTLPLRMRFKELRLRHLGKQLQCQNQQLESLMLINCKERSRIEVVEKQRTTMLMNLTRYSEYIDQAKSQAIQMANDLLDDVQNLFIK